MGYLQKWQHFWSSKQDPAYVGLTAELDEESSIPQNNKSSSWFKQAFAPNFWSLCTLGLLIVVIGGFPRSDNHDRMSIWAMPSSGSPSSRPRILESL